MALLPVLFVVAAGAVSAQAELADFVQAGRATWEILGAGYQAAHPSLPIGSTPMVRNTATGAEVEVAIVGRIPLSGDRVIDVSVDAARAIGLEPGGQVLVYFPPPAVPPAALSNPSTDVLSQHGVNIVIHNHVIPQSAWMGGATLPSVMQAPPEPPRPAVRVTPGMPDPASGGIYSLRVGSWVNMNAAFAAFLQLRDAGMNAINEFINGMYSAYATGIHSTEVAAVVQILGNMGFLDLHVQRQH